MEDIETTGERISRSEPVTISTAQGWYLSWVADVFIYIIVLNLAVEYTDAIEIDSFTISILAASLMKLLLVLILHFKRRTSTYFRDRGAQHLSIATTVLILFFSKFVILEILDISFGEEVEIQGFISLNLLIIAMMLVSFLFEWSFRSLALPESAKPDQSGNR